MERGRERSDRRTGFERGDNEEKKKRNCNRGRLWAVVGRGRMWEVRRKCPLIRSIDNDFTSQKHLVVLKWNPMISYDKWIPPFQRSTCVDTTRIWVRDLHRILQEKIGHVNYRRKRKNFKEEEEGRGREWDVWPEAFCHLWRTRAACCWDPESQKADIDFRVLFLC